jgi:hypothetical protein
VTDAVLDEGTTWQNRPLEAVYQRVEEVGLQASGSARKLTAMAAT